MSVTIWNWFADFWKWVDNWHDVLIAVFTFSLFVVTAGLVCFTKKLWRSTGELVRGSEKTAEMQLRAYLLVKGCALRRTNDSEKLFINIEIRNFGQTPAYDVMTWVGTMASDLPLKTELPEPQKPFRQSKSIIAPGNHEMSIVPVEPLTTNQWSYIDKEEGAIYVWGGISYRDAFNKNRKVSFRLMLTGEVGHGNGKFCNCEDGNKAD